MAEGVHAHSSLDGPLEAKTLTDVLIWLEKEGFPEHVLSAFEGAFVNLGTTYTSSYTADLCCFKLYLL